MKVYTGTNKYPFFLHTQFNKNLHWNTAVWGAVFVLKHSCSSIFEPGVYLTVAASHEGHYVIYLSRVETSTRVLYFSNSGTGKL